MPFNRMQLWTFPSQRDNEVSRGAENEAVVCPGRGGGHGACGSRLNQVFVAGAWSGEGRVVVVRWGSGVRGSSREIPWVWTFDSEPRLPGYTSSLVPKDCPFSPEKCYYLTACSSREKVIIGDC